MINFHLFTRQFLNGLIVFFAFKGESNFFDVVEYPFEFVEADEILMPFLMDKQTLLYFIILLNTQPMLVFIDHLGRGWNVSLLRVDLPEIDIVSKPDVLDMSALIKSRVAPVCVR